MQHGVPALLSFVIPGLGQLVKRQTHRAIAIFFGFNILFFVGYRAWRISKAADWPFPQGTFGDFYQYELSLVLSIVGGVLLLAAVGMWLWNIVDAYNASAGRE